jgi:hypothetical protein
MTTTIFGDREIRGGIGGNRRILLRAALLTLAFGLVILVISNLVRVTRIGAGYVGVEVNLAGSQRGAQDIPVRTGWVFYSPLKTEVIPFPTFVQTVKWTADVSEGPSLQRGDCLQQQRRTGSARRRYRCPMRSSQPGCRSST